MQMTRRDVMRMVYRGQRPPYVPWVGPAHAVEGDVPVENTLAFIEEVQQQPGYAGMRG